MLSKNFYNELRAFLLELMGSDLGNYRLPDNSLRPAIAFVPPSVPTNWVMVGMCEVVIYTGISKPIPLLNYRVGGYQEITINIVNYDKSKNLRDVNLRVMTQLMTKPWVVSAIPTLPDSLGTLEQLSITARIPVNIKMI